MSRAILSNAARFRTSTSLLSSHAIDSMALANHRRATSIVRGSFPKLSAISAQAASNAARSINAVLVIFREMVQIRLGRALGLVVARRLQRVLAPSNDTKHLIGKSSSSDLPVG